jgi:GxxExxY protein
MIITKQYVNQVAYDIVACAIEVHRHLGAGLLESVYQVCLLKELENKGLEVRKELYLPIIYKGIDLGNKLRLDILVNDLVIVELKSVETVIPLYKAQLLSYMKLTQKPKGLLINFNSETITKGCTSLVNEYFAILP